MQCFRAPDASGAIRAHTSNLLKPAAQDGRKLNILALARPAQSAARSYDLLRHSTAGYKFCTVAKATPTNLRYPGSSTLGRIIN
jgi:hypothetical protein